MDTKKAPVVPGLIALAIIVAAGAFWYAHRSPVASVSQPSVAMTATTSPTEETLDPASVSNLEAVKAAFDTNAQSAHYYTIDFTNVAKISYEGRDMYLGNLQDTYGNG
ncbi:MAG: hypothetical protein KGH68_02465, partial [Patescibacteria group bacterium]|nr:hypothetical protein [Patescibacteria group bacterium]